MERTTVLEAASYVAHVLAEYDPEFRFLRDMPVGPLNRIADNSKMLAELGLAPVPFREGVAKTWDWYTKTKDVGSVRVNLERLLIERK